MQINKGGKIVAKKPATKIYSTIKKIISMKEKKT